MHVTDKQAIRQKVTGVLLRHARSKAGRSQAEMAASLHISRHRYADYEHGRRDPSLSELEQIAELCGVPLGYFFDDDAVVEDERLEVGQVVEPRLQRKILGALLRQARQQAGKSQKECAQFLGIPARRISQYESGDREVPGSELERLAAYLGVKAGYFSAEPGS